MAYINFFKGGGGAGGGGRLYFSKALYEGLIFGGAYIRRGLSMEGNLRFEIDRASLFVGSKFTGFALFYSVFEGNFPLNLEGRFNGGFFALPVWGAYIWRGLYIEGLIFGILRYAKGAVVNSLLLPNNRKRHN